MAILLLRFYGYRVVTVLRLSCCKGFTKFGKNRGKYSICSFQLRYSISCLTQTVQSCPSFYTLFMQLSDNIAISLDTARLNDKDAVGISFYSNLNLDYYSACMS